MADWRDQAACLDDDDPEAWYVTEKDTERTAHALAVCAVCPVAGDCLAFARQVDERYGIWGGQTPAGRGVTGTGHPETVARDRAIRKERRDAQDALRRRGY